MRDITFTYTAKAVEGKAPEAKSYTGALKACWPIRGSRMFSVETAAGLRHFREDRLTVASALELEPALNAVFDGSPKIMTLAGPVPIDSMPVGLGLVTEKLLTDLVIGCVDLETTGLYPWGKDKYNNICPPDRVTEFGIVCGGITGDTMEFSALINPGRKINPEASAVTGMTDAMLTLAPTFNYMADHIANVLSTCDVVIAHYAGFEQGFLASEFQRCRVPAPDMIMLDTKVMAVKAGGFTNHKQSTVAAALGIAYAGDAHRAIPDAQVCMKLARKFIEVRMAKGDKTLGDVVRYCADK
jgi:DNA polymerase III epsilon subunit-like protein